jgi:ATP-binding cassette, subfamily B, bacterial PglK
VIAGLQSLRNLVGPQSWSCYVRTYVLAAIAALLETASIAAVLPVVAMITGKETEATGQWFTVNTALFLLGMLYVTGLMFRAYAVQQTARTNMSEGYNFSARLFRSALQQPYDWNFSHHSADLRSAILSDTQELIAAVFVPLGRLIAQAILVVAVTCVLLVAQPMATLVFGATIILVYVVTFAVLRRPLRRDGERQILANTKRHRLSSEAFQAGRELRLSHLEGRFADEFAAASGQLAQASTNRSIYTDLPKLLLEAILFGILAWIALHGAANGGAISADSLPTLVLFAAAGLKLFPMGHLVFANLALLRAGWPVVGKFEALLQGLSEPVAEEPCPRLRASLVLDGVGFSYSGGTGPVLQDVRLEALPGQKIAITGPSGAGKSTLIDVIAGLLSPVTGRVMIDGAPLLPNQSRSWQKQIRYCPQMPVLFDQTIAQNITLGADYTAEQVMAALHLACLDDAVAGKVAGPESPVGEQGRNLSGGQIKRIGIARALIDDVAVYLLDEPTSNLDAKTAEAVIARVFAARPNAIFFIVTHDQTLANLCNSVVDLSGQARPNQG